MLTVELNGLAGLLTKVVNNHGLNRHLNDVCGVRPIKFGTKKFGERVFPLLSQGTDYIFTYK